MLVKQQESEVVKSRVELQNIYDFSPTEGDAVFLKLIHRESALIVH